MTESVSNAPQGWPTHSPEGYALFYALEPVKPGSNLSKPAVDARTGEAKTALMYDNQTFPGGIEEIEDYKVGLQIRDASMSQGTDQTVPITHTPYGDALFSVWKDQLQPVNIHAAFAMQDSTWMEQNAGRLSGPDWMAFYSQFQAAVGGPEGQHQYMLLHQMGGTAPNGEQCGPPYNGVFVFATGVWNGPTGIVIKVTMPTP